MEALVAVGLVSNIAEFLDVGSKLCVAASQLYKDGQTEGDQECAILIDDLLKVCGDLEASVMTTSGTTGTNVGVNQRISILASRCMGLARGLSTKLQTVAVPLGSNRGAVLKTALKRMWNRSEINDIAGQLGQYRQELAFNILTNLHKASQTHTQLSSALEVNLRPLDNKISAVEARLSTIMPELEAGFLDVATKMNRLEQSHQCAHSTIQSLSRQGVEHHNRIIDELKIIDSQNTTQHDKMISHLGGQVTELEQVVRSLREQQFFHVSGNYTRIVFQPV